MWLRLLGARQVFTPLSVIKCICMVLPLRRMLVTVAVLASDSLHVVWLSQSAGFLILFLMRTLSPSANGYALVVFLVGGAACSLSAASSCVVSSASCRRTSCSFLVSTSMEFSVIHFAVSLETML